MSDQAVDVKTAVQQRYGAIARGELSGCGCSTPSGVAAAIGYSKEDLEIAGQANLGLGCGNPLALAQLKPGMTVLDLGSGAGFDAFLAWRQVGATGHVIGVDMTDDMLAQARKNASDLGANNVEFRKGHIENLPVDNNSVDFIISNCVINLSSDKAAVMREIYRVLKPGGRFAISDIVLLGELPESIREDVNAYVGCIAGASLLTDYVHMVFDAGLVDVSLPEIVCGKNLLKQLSAEDLSCCGAGVNDEAAGLLVSVKLHGRKK
jgi:SAM-dependent methyltransferase